MNREKQAKETMERLYGKARKIQADHAVDPEFYDIKERLIYGEIYQNGRLDIRQRHLVTLAVLTAGDHKQEGELAVKAALADGITPEEIKEVVYQCAPYTGFPKAERMLQQINEVLENRSVPLPLLLQGTTTEENRLERGIAAQKSIFGDGIDTMRANAPEILKELQDYLSAFCFGDTYTRQGLDIPMRELLTFSVLITLGGCEPQVKEHIQGNLNVGNTKEILIGAVIQALPYIGFPRSLNAIQAVMEG